MGCKWKPCASVMRGLDSLEMTTTRALLCLRTDAWITLPVSGPWPPYLFFIFISARVSVFFFFFFLSICFIHHYPNLTEVKELNYICDVHNAFIAAIIFKMINYRNLCCKTRVLLILRIIYKT